LLYGLGFRLEPLEWFEANPGLENVKRPDGAESLAITGFPPALVCGINQGMAKTKKNAAAVALGEPGTPVIC